MLYSHFYKIWKYWDFKYILYTCIKEKNNRNGGSCYEEIVGVHPVVFRMQEGSMDLHLAHNFYDPVSGSRCDATDVDHGGIG